MKPPQGAVFPGYWVALVSTIALVLTAPGQTILVSLLNVPLRRAFDLEPLWINSAYTVATILASLPLVWMGERIDRYGPRRSLIAIAIGFGASCCFMASVAHPAMVVVAFFLLRCLGQGALALASSHALAMWFHERLGTISGIRSVVLFAAWAPLPALTIALFARLGWRLTWASFGAVVAVVVGLMSFRFVHDRPEDLGLQLDDGQVPSVASHVGPGSSLPEAKRTRAYWLLAFSAALPPMIGTAIIFDIQPLLAARGVDATTAAYCVSAWSATMAVMALPSGRLVDTTSPGPLIAAGMAAIATSCAAMLLAHAALTALIALVVYAVGQSLVTAVVATTTARYFGRTHHGAIRSSMSRIGVVATGVGPLLFGASVRLTGAYDSALIGFAVLCAPPLVGAFWLEPPAPRPLVSR